MKEKGQGHHKFRALSVINTYDVGLYMPHAFFFSFTFFVICCDGEVLLHELNTKKICRLGIEEVSFKQVHAHVLFFFIFSLQSSRQIVSFFQLKNFARIERSRVLLIKNCPEIPMKFHKTPHLNYKEINSTLSPLKHLYNFIKKLFAMC